jgi:adenosyl cobinamide kinase/adenosyl cobinamide phosphate guanylyltransferase
VDSVIIFGLEQIVLKCMTGGKQREAFQDWLKEWFDWEQGSQERSLFLVGTDIGKGIVPIEKEARKWRDLTGWCFQDVAKYAERVDVIWYGLNQQIK